MSLRDFIREISPPWLRRKWGERILYPFGAMADVLVEHLHQGLRARWPSRTGDPASLELIGRDRVIGRGLEEPDATFATRLRQWKATHRTKGNPFNLLRQIRAFLGNYSPIRLRYVNENGDWFTLDDTTGETYEMRQFNFAWDATSLAPNWSRFWIIIYPLTSGFSDDDGTWGDPDPDDWGDHPELSFGSSATVAQIEGIRSIIATSKSGASRCPSIIVAQPTDLEPLGPGWPSVLPEEVAWSDEVADVQIPRRLSSGLYWKGPLT